MAWSKVKFFYIHGLSGLTATSEAAGFLVANVLDMLEGTLWKATSSSDQYISFDAGVGSTYTADYIAIASHNLKTVTLQYSSNGSAWSNAVTFAVTENKVVVKEFPSQTARYWRAWLSDLTGIPYIGICIWGQAVELGYVWGTSFDPNAQENKANVNISQTGYLLGIHNNYTERQIQINIKNATPAVYDKVAAWWEASGLNNFFVAWNISGDPNAVYLMRPDSKFSNPYQAGGTRRHITINLKGRKE